MKYLRIKFLIDRRQMALAIDWLRDRGLRTWVNGPDLEVIVETEVVLLKKMEEAGIPLGFETSWLVDQSKTPLWPAGK